MLTPTRIYIASLLPLVQAGKIKALAHITGGGITENLPRVLPAQLSARVDLNQLRLPNVFAWMMQAGAIPAHEMLTTFNCGVGMVLVVESAQAEAIAASLTRAGETVMTLGTLVPAGAQRVLYEGALCAA